MSTPTCPACGAKFSHDPAMDCCRKCGLPASIKVLEGSDRASAIKQWQKGKLPFVPQPKIDFTSRPSGSRTSRRPKRHGVHKGRGKVSQSSPRPKYPKKKVRRG